MSAYTLLSAFINAKNAQMQTQRLHLENTLCFLKSRQSPLKNKHKKPGCKQACTGFFHLSVYHLVEPCSTSTRTFVKCPLILYLRTSKMLSISSGAPSLHKRKKMPRCKLKDYTSKTLCVSSVAAVAA